MRLSVPIRRATAIAVLIAMLLVAQIAFAGGKAETSSAPAGNQPVNLSIWTMRTVASQVDNLKQDLAAFEAENPNVHASVEAVSYDTVYQRLLTSGRGGELPDVFNCIEAMVAFTQARNEIQPVDSIVSDLGGADKFFTNYLKWVSKDNHYWAVPDWALHQGVYYRKSLFKKFNISVPKTWDELLAAAQKLNLDTNGDGKVNAYGMGVPLGKNMVAQQTLGGILYSEGVHIFNPKTGEYEFGSDKAKFIKSMDYLVKLYKAASPQASLDWSWGDYRNAFVQGVTNMTFGWGAEVLIAMNDNPGLLDDIGLFPFPSGPDMTSYPPTSQFGGAYYFTVSKNSDARFAAAQKLLKFLFDKKRVAERANTRPVFALPAYKPALDDYYGLKIPAQFSGIIHTIESQIMPYEYRQGLEAGLNPLAGEIESSNIFGEAIHNVIVSGWSSEKAFTWLNEQLQALNKKING